VVSDVRLSLDEVRALALRGLAASGIFDENAAVIADVMTSAERDGCQSHGLFRMAGYCNGARSGRIDGKAKPTLHDDAPGVIRVDAHHGFAAPAMAAGRATLAKKARQQGIAAMPIVHSHHFAALWYDVDALAEDGLVAFAFVNSKSFVAPAGGIEKLYGTNPMAFAWPRVGKPPMIFDQASSASARGEIQIHLRDGKPIPEGWAIDSHGNPTTDPQAGLDGAQLPFGGHKGAAIALMVEMLAVGLTGGKFGFEAAADVNTDGGPSEGGQMMIAMDPARFAANGDGGTALSHAETLFEKILEQDGTRLPSDRRYAARERTPTEGISIPQSLHEACLACCGS
jgi:LDH2 family malate/lactate/ureidoglycolate dehydrogenase